MFDCFLVCSYFLCSFANVILLLLRLIFTVVYYVGFVLNMTYGFNIAFNNVKSVLILMHGTKYCNW